MCFSYDEDVNYAFCKLCLLAITRSKLCVFALFDM
jgi:hypothetical protein